MLRLSPDSNASNAPILSSHERCSFTDLPTELVLEINSYLPRADINALRRVSHWLASIMTPVLGRLSAAAVDRSLSRRSLLHWAAANGHTALLRLLLFHGADVHHSDHRGWTGLHSAVLRRQPATLSILLQHGADAESRNVDGWRPLHLAAITGSREIVALLLDAGVNIDARSRALYYKTALHYAALQGHRQVVELLMQRGADLGAKDNTSMTAGEKAILAGQMEVVQLVFGAESEQQIRLATVNLVHQFKVVGQEMGILRRHIQLLLTLEAWAVLFRG